MDGICTLLLGQTQRCLGVEIRHSTDADRSRFQARVDLAQTRDKGGEVRPENCIDKAKDTSNEYDLRKEASAGM